MLQRGVYSQKYKLRNDIYKKKVIISFIDMKDKFDRKIKQIDLTNGYWKNILQSDELKFRNFSL